MKTSDLRPTLNGVRNYVIRASLTLKAESVHNGAVLAFGFYEIDADSLESHRQIKLIFENGTVTSDHFLPCGSAEDFSRLWGAAVSGKTCQIRFFVQKHKLAGLAVTCESHTAIFALADKQIPLCSGLSMRFAMGITEGDGEIVTEEPFIAPMEDCTVGVYRGGIPKESLRYEDSEKTSFPNGYVLHYLDFSRISSFAESGYYVTNDAAPLFVGVVEKTLHVVTGVTPAYLLFTGNAIPQRLQSYALRMKVRFGNSGAGMGVYHNANVDAVGKLEAHIGEGLCRELPISLMRDGEWHTLTLTYRHGTLACVSLFDRYGVLEHTVSPTDPSVELANRKGLFISEGSEIEISEVVLIAGGECSSDAWIWPEEKGALVQSVCASPVACDGYQLGCPQKDCAEDGAGVRYLRLIGRINATKPQCFQRFGFSVELRYLDGSIRMVESVATRGEALVPSDQDRGLECYSAKALDREWIYASDGIEVELQAMSRISVRGFADKQDGTRIYDRERSITVQNGQLCSDMTELKGIYTADGCGVIPPYREGAYDHLALSEYHSHFAIYQNTDAEEYRRYLKNIQARYGFSEYTSRRVRDNLFATYTNGTTHLSVNYIPSRKAVYLAADRADVSELPPIEADCPTVAAPLITQYNGCCGFLIRLPDGRFLIHDGGMPYERNYRTLFELLCAQNVREGKPVIAAWIFSHMHVDHVGAFTQFGRYADQIELQRIVWNIPSFDTYTMNGERANQCRSMREQIVLVKETYRRYFSHVPIVIPHAGQMMRFGEAQLEILYTQEDLAPLPMSGSTNSSSVVYRLHLNGQSIMLLGDSHYDTADVLYQIYGSHLKSDIVQIAHHGYQGGGAEMYQAIGADTAIWTTYYSDFLDRGLASFPENCFDVRWPKENLIMSLPHSVGACPMFVRSFETDEKPGV